MQIEHGSGLAQSFKQHRIYACILAGGKSRRMGRDKALLNHQNRTLLDRCLHILNCFPFEDILISRGDIKDSHQGVRDVFKDSGPVGGIYSVCEQAALSTGDYLLVLPVDMPNVSTELIAYLLRHIASNKAASSNFYFESVLFPFLVQFNHPLHTSLRRRLMAHKTASVKEFLSAYEAQALAVPSNERVENLNTPQDWRAFIADKV